MRVNAGPEGPAYKLSCRRVLQGVQPSCFGEIETKTSVYGHSTLFRRQRPEAGTGRHMRVVQIEFYDTETGDTEELIRVWFEKQRRAAMKSS